MSTKLRASRSPRPLWWLALGLWVVYLVSSSGGFEVSDAVVRYETAESWLEGRGGALPAELAWSGGSVAPDGRVFTYYGPLQSVLMVPVLALVRALPALPVERSVVETFAIALILFPLLSTLALALLFLALRELGYDARSSYLACTALGLGTMFWYYARMGQEEHLVALGLALWLYGASRLAAARSWPLLCMAGGGLIAFASRWATAPTLAVLAGISLALALRRRHAVRLPDLSAALALVAAGLATLLLYNHARYEDAFETGYQLTYAQWGQSMFVAEGYANRVAALLVSPYRGLLVYSPLLLFAVPGLLSARRGATRVVHWAGGAVLITAILFFAAFRDWTAGHAWGPRFLTAPHVLLAPALAAAFVRWRRAALVVPLAAAVQLLSVVLPGSTEEYARYLLDQRRPGHCSEWRIECSAVGQRLPRALGAIANTFTDRPGVVVRGRPLVAPEVVLTTSDYRTLYWWPVRIAYRLGLFPAWAALLVCGGGLILGAACLWRSWRLAASGGDAAPIPAAASPGPPPAPRGWTPAG